MNFATLAAFATSQLCQDHTQTVWLLPPDFPLDPPAGLPNVTTYHYCDKPLPDGLGYPLPPNLCDESCFRIVGAHVHALRTPYSAGLEALLRLTSDAESPHYPFSTSPGKRFAVVVLDQPLGEPDTIPAGVRHWNAPRIYPENGESKGGFGSSEFARWGLLETSHGLLPQIPDFYHDLSEHDDLEDISIACQTTEEAIAEILRSTASEINRDLIQNSVCYFLEYIKYVKHLRVLEDHADRTESDTNNITEGLLSKIQSQLGPSTFPEVPAFSLGRSCGMSAYPSKELLASLDGVEVLFLKDAQDEALTDASYTVQQYAQAVEYAYGNCRHQRRWLVSLVGISIGALVVGAMSICLVCRKRRKRRVTRNRLSSVAETRYFDAATSSDVDHTGADLSADRFQWFDRVTLSMFE